MALLRAGLGAVLTAIGCLLLLAAGVARGTSDHTDISTTSAEEIATSPSSTTSKPAHEPRIVVIGAGASGIAAAARLLENGFKEVTVLEAENRIGGRINTVDFGGYRVDLGSQWVHGEEGNLVYEMAWPLGLLDKCEDVDRGIRMTFHDSHGHQLEESLASRLGSFFIDYVQSAEAQGPVNASWSSLGDFLEHKFKREFADSIIANDSSRYLHLLELVAISADSADSWIEIALTGREYDECPGDRMINWKELGYEKIFDILTKKLPRPEDEIPVLNHTVLGAEVTRIYWSKVNGTHITIMTANNDVYKADHVILTVSLGVLKERKWTMFSPPLPRYKIRTIRGLEYGTSAKILLEFEKPFWKLGDKRLLMMAHVWDNETRAALEKTKDDERLWTLGTFGFTTIEHRPNLLMLWVNGRYARLMETLPEELVLKHTTELLYRFYSKTHQVTKPLKMMRSQWYRNPHFRGSYSYRSRRSIEQDTWAAKLEEPLDPDDMKLLFAGEAASPHRFSTVDGAIGAGWRAADRLIKLYKGGSETNLQPEFDDSGELSINTPEP